MTRRSALAGCALAVLPAAGLAAPPVASVVTGPTAAWDLAAAPAGPRAVLVWERGTTGVLWHSRRDAGSWTAPARLGAEAGRSVRSTVEVDVNARGDAVLAWRRSTGRGERLLVATRTPAGRWSPLRRIATAGRLGAVHVDVAPDGGAVVAWGQVRDLRRPTPVRAAVRPPGGVFGPVLRAGTSDPSSSPLDLALAALPGGRAVLAWTDLRVVEVVRFARGRWGAPVTLPVVRDGVQVRVSARGDAFATWFTRPRGGAGSVNSVVGTVRGAVAPAGRPWGAPVPLSGRDAPVGVEDVFLSGTVLEVDGRGRAYAAWVRFARFVPERARGTAGFGGAVVVATADARGWRRGTVLSRRGAEASSVRLVTGGAGALLMWTGSRRSRDDEPLLSRRTRGAGAAWDAPRRIAAPGADGAGLVVPALGADGTAAVGVGNADDDTVLLRRPAPAAPWRPVDVQEAGAFGSLRPVSLLVAGDGAAWALLERYPGAAYASRDLGYALVPLTPP